MFLEHIIDSIWRNGRDVDSRTWEQEYNEDNCYSKEDLFNFARQCLHKGRIDGIELEKD